MRLRSIFIAGLLLGLFSVSATPFQKNKDEEAGKRSVQGAVRDLNDNPVEGAVVQMKDTKTLQVRSFITHPDGNYIFRGLSTNVDYELKADHGGMASDIKRLSAFDSRVKAVINLKLENKK